MMWCAQAFYFSSVQTSAQSIIAVQQFIMLVLRESGHNTIDSNRSIGSGQKEDESSSPHGVLRISLQSLDREDLWHGARTGLLSAVNIWHKCSSCLCMRVCVWACVFLEGVLYADSKGRGYGVSQQTLHNTYTFGPNHCKGKNSWENLVCVISRFSFGVMSCLGT